MRLGDTVIHKPTTFTCVIWRAGSGDCITFAVSVHLESREPLCTDLFDLDSGIIAVEDSMPRLKLRLYFLVYASHGLEPTDVANSQGHVQEMSSQYQSTVVHTHMLYR